MKYAVLICAMLVAAATMPAMVAASDDGGVYADIQTTPTVVVAEASGKDQTEGEEDTEFC